MVLQIRSDLPLALFVFPKGDSPEGGTFIFCCIQSGVKLYPTFLYVKRGILVLVATREHEMSVSLHIFVERCSGNLIRLVVGHLDQSLNKERGHPKRET